VLHIFRHSAAKLRRDAGESIEDVSRFLDHSSLAVATVYLLRLEGQADTSWGKVAAAIGIKTALPRRRDWQAISGTNRIIMPVELALAATRTAPATTR
jgi:hypothetical protein